MDNTKLEIISFGAFCLLESNNKAVNLVNLAKHRKDRMLVRSRLLCLLSLILVLLLGMDAKQLRVFSDVSKGNDLKEDLKNVASEKRIGQSLEDRLKRRVQSARQLQRCENGRFMLLCK